MHVYIYKDGVLAEPNLYQLKINQSQNDPTICTGIYTKFPTVSETTVLVNVIQRQLFEWFFIKMMIQKKAHFEIIHIKNLNLVLNYPNILENDIKTALHNWGKDIHHV